MSRPIWQSHRVATTLRLASFAQVMPRSAQAVPRLSCRSLASSPSPLPHCTHLPNFQWCGPSLGPATREHTPEADSMAEMGGCLCVDTSPCTRLETLGELSGSRHFGHSSVLYLSRYNKQAAAKLRGCGTGRLFDEGGVRVEPLEAAHRAALTDAMVPPGQAALAALVKVARPTALVGSAGGCGGRDFSGVSAAT